MKVAILAVYCEHPRLMSRIKDRLTEIASQMTQDTAGQVDAVIIEMESTIDALDANLRQLAALRPQ
jgi:hypothetical protein